MLTKFLSINKEDLSKAFKQVRRSEKYIPFVGKYIHELKEYCKYIFEYKQVVKENEKYRNIHKGKRCFVIGNGPSLLKQNLSFLKNEYTISVNSMTSTNEFNIVKPKYHVIVDYIRFDKKIPTMVENLKNLRNLKHKPTYIFPAKFKKIVEENGYNKDTKIVYLAYKTELKKFNEIDFTKRIPFFTNVTNVALLWAIYLGFSEIYLIGCDMTGIVKVYDEKENFTSGGHFYTEKGSKKERDYIKELQSNKSNETFLSSYAQTFKTFRYTQYFAKRKGIKIFNATNGGTLDVFERVKYETLFNKTKRTT